MTQKTYRRGDVMPRVLFYGGPRYEAHFERFQIGMAWAGDKTAPDNEHYYRRRISISFAWPIRLHIGNNHKPPELIR